MSTTANEMYHAAQGYIRDGQPVFPCIPSGAKAKAPLTKNGFLDATVHLPTIKSWFKQYGAVALGIPTGVKYDVLDVDTKHGADGRVHLKSLTELGLLNGCKKVSRTPSGGWHLYFNAAPGLTNKARGALGLDLRAMGGYVVAAPSYIETPDYSGFYVDEGQTKGSTDDPLLWDLIIANISPIDTSTNKPVELLRVEKRASVAHLRAWLAERGAGERNNSLHWAVSRCIENGIDPYEMMEPALLIGLEEHEIRLTVGSALRRAGLNAEDLDTEAEAMFGHD